MSMPFPIQSDSHGHQSTNDILVPQNDSDHSTLATPQVVSVSAESPHGLPEGDPTVSLHSSSASVKKIPSRHPCP